MVLQKYCFAFRQGLISHKMQNDIYVAGKYISHSQLLQNKKKSPEFCIFVFGAGGII